LRELAAARVSVEMLAPEPRFWYRPLAVAEPFRLGEVTHYELDALTRSLGASFTPGALVAIDAWRRIAHTSANAEIEYDHLLVACGAVPTPAVPGAATFRGPADTAGVEALLAELVRGDARSVAFVIPWGAVWSLPAYELALLTAGLLEREGVTGREVTLVTPEEEPLQLFGPTASEAVRTLLAERGVSVELGVYPSEVVEGELRLLPQGSVPADRFVALPRLRGTPVDGLPQTINGFVPVDAHCRVHGLEHVFAAGDITSFTVKQGGLATQQADVAAEAIAADAGADVTPSRFRPVLRGLLLTGGEPRYLRRELTGRPEHEPVAAPEPLWWPPAKIVGRYLAPFLASLAGAESPPDVESVVPGALGVEVELEPGLRHELTAQRLVLEHDEPVAAFMSDALVLAPEDTLGEAAQRLVEHDLSAAAVCDFGKLIGILTRHDLLAAAASRVHPSEARVRQWMTAEPVTVTPRTPAAPAASLMREYGIAHLIVAESGRPHGLLRWDDVATRAVPRVGLGF
jgi:sulfide:quinone oxidoreductase